jgi:hypothetical protein
MGNGVPVAINATDNTLVCFVVALSVNMCKANISCIIVLAIRSSRRMLECDRSANPELNYKIN